VMCIFYYIAAPVGWVWGDTNGYHSF